MASIWRRLSVRAMRIAYLTYEVPDGRSGVAKKITAQSRYWREQGHEVRHFVLATPRPDETSSITFLVSRPVRPPMLAAALANETTRRALHDWRPDIVYVRQMLWWPGAVAALDAAPLVIEYNSIARHEYRAVSSLKYAIECFSRGFLPRAARGVIAVTRELAQDVPATEARRIVVSNGYDLAKVRPRVPPQHARPQLLLVGSPGQSWHGVDKVLRLAHLLPEFDFHLVVPQLSINGPDNLFCHGALYGEDLVKRYEQTDVALGTLALHRKNMREAAPLKTRECLAYGIPVIGGYDDADLDGAGYWLNIGNTEHNVEQAVQPIREFVQSWRGRLPDRNDIERRVGYAGKESQRLAFLEQVVRDGR
ncbi:glycosyltransferase [Bordetella hinzii]|nr:glycosyltransferase [Bordetella hinzii]